MPNKPDKYKLNQTVNKITERLSDFPVITCQLDDDIINEVCHVLIDLGHEVTTVGNVIIVGDWYEVLIND